MKQACSKNAAVRLTRFRVAESQSLRVPLFLLVLLSSCGGDLHSGHRRVEVNGAFSVEMPAGLEITKGLHNHAGLQAQCRNERLFLIGMEEDKKFLDEKGLHYSLEQYAAFVAAKSGEGLRDARPGAMQACMADSLPALQCTLTGAMDGPAGRVPMLMRVMVAEAPHQFVQLIAWMPLEKEKHLQPIVDAVLFSLRCR